MPADRSAQDIAIEALGNVLVGHLRVEALRRRPPDSTPLASRLRSTRPGEAPPPILVALDGPGAGDLLDGIAPKLRGSRGDPEECRWTVIHFDAWQFQRVEPPWWWLVEAFAQQVRADLREKGWRAQTHERTRAVAWRVSRIAKDPWVVALFVLAIVGLLSASLIDMRSILETTAGLTTSLTTVGALGLAIANAFRRRVLVFSPGNEKAVLRANDPMAAFQERYAFLLRARPAPVAFLVENLDRCRSAYVVELLEGIQTLLKHRPAARPHARALASNRLAATLERLPILRERLRWLGHRKPVRPSEPSLVAFLVAADESWLCDSFVEVYNGRHRSGGDHGRPPGLAFLDKVFDHSLHLPLVPARRPIAATRCSTAEAKLKQAEQETAIRKIISAAEGANAGIGERRPSLQQLRIAAVERLGEIEDVLGQRLCFDTTWQLIQLADQFDAAAEVRGQLHTAYCSQRTGQLLGGHEIDDDDDAVCRLGLWTVLALKWPLLVEYLVAHPDDIAYLRTEHQPAAPPDCPIDLAAVFADRRARQVVVGFPGRAELTSDEVRRFSVPLPAPQPRVATRDPHDPCEAPVLLCAGAGSGDQDARALLFDWLLQRLARSPRRESAGSGRGT